jgi:hypothetical protein
MKKLSAESEFLSCDFQKLYEEIIALRNFDDDGVNPFASLKFVRLVAKNQEKRVLQLLSCNLS